jgi:hypothetical protein
MERFGKKDREGPDFDIVLSLNGVSAVSAGMPILILRPSGHVLSVVTQHGHVFRITTSCHFVRLVLISYEIFGYLLCPHPEPSGLCILIPDLLVQSTDRALLFTTPGNF